MREAGSRGHTALHIGIIIERVRTDERHTTQASFIESGYGARVPYICTFLLFEDVEGT